LQLAGFSLSKGKRYEEDSRDWYEYVRIQENINEHGTTGTGGDDGDHAGVREREDLGWGFGPAGIAADYQS
jgi:hypothetical protein